ncbi:hypothetical protein V6N13_104367 [Hibiscus sabdariffa]
MRLPLMEILKGKYALVEKMVKTTMGAPTVGGTPTVPKVVVDQVRSTFGIVMSQGGVGTPTMALPSILLVVDNPTPFFINYIFPDDKCSVGILKSDDVVDCKGHGLEMKTVLSVDRLYSSLYQ